MEHDVGDLARLSVVFKDADGAPTNPTTVTLKVRRAGVTTTYTDAVNDSAGSYHRDVSVDAAGLWVYRWIGTGAVQAAEEGRFFVGVPGA